MNKTRLALLLLFLVLVGLVACDSGPSEPGDQVAAVIESTREAAEDGSTRGIMRHVSDNYRDERGQDAERIRELVRGYLMAGGDQVSIDLDIQSIEVPTRTRANAELEVGFSGAERGGRLLARLRNRYEVSLTFDLEEDDEWRVVSAEWSARD